MAPETIVMAAGCEHIAHALTARMAEAEPAERDALAVERQAWLDILGKLLLVEPASSLIAR